MSNRWATDQGGKDQSGTGKIVSWVDRGAEQRGGEERPEDAEREVAIKVLHPGVVAEIELDLAIVSTLARTLEALPWLGLEWLALSEAVSQFQTLLQAQLDLRNEGEALAQFRKNFNVPNSLSPTGSQALANGSDKRGRAAAAPKVTFPEPFVATQHVLVESFEAGVPIREIINEGLAATEGQSSLISFTTSPIYFMMSSRE